MDAMTLQCRVRAEVRTPKTDSPQSSTVTPELLPNPKGNMEAKECPFLLFAWAFHTHLTAMLPRVVPFKGVPKRTAILI